MTDLDKLKAVNILSVAGKLGITTRQVGQNYSSICPFHSEKIPSFILFSDTNSWRCFGSCSDGGSNLDLVMKSLGKDFSSAIDWMESQYGLQAEKVEIDFKLVGQKPLPIQHKNISTDKLKYWHGALLYTKRDVWFRDRKFTLKTIKNEGFGWDGERYVVPVWKDKPWESHCIGVRLRKSELCEADAFKYIGKKGHNKPCMYNRHTVNGSEYMFVFAGELDAKLCSQDGLPAVSLVNGMTSFNSFPQNWAHFWFPLVKYILVLFDRKEAHIAGRLASDWERQKGRNTAFVIHWPISPIDNIKNNGYDDYNDFRLRNYNIQEFLGICRKQVGDFLWKTN